LWGAIVGGVALRLIWIGAVDPVQTSDAEDYIALAHALLDRGTYCKPYSIFLSTDVVLCALRPPGYPLVLASLMALMGPHAWIPALANLGAFVVSSLAAWGIAARLFGYQAAVVTILLLALWPSNIMLTGLALGDSLCGAVLVTAAWALGRAAVPGWGVVVGGCLIGYAALVRPPALLIGVVWAAVLLWEAARAGRGFVGVGLFLVCIAVVIAPWTFRNYVVLGSFVPISTNGGDIFYRANNPLATGGWTARGERELWRYAVNEVEWDEKGYEWGMEWIADHPAEFARLAIRKQAILLGRDDTGAYWAIARGRGDTGPLFVKAVDVSNAWWLICWMLLMGAVITAATVCTTEVRATLLVWAILTQVAVYSVYESQPRHHTSFVPILTVLAGAIAHRNRARRGYQWTDDPDAVLALASRR
jgi:4-amino-4-deoxy-L-arabinose transferase-like glycosyltransferase